MCTYLHYIIKTYFFVINLSVVWFLSFACFCEPLHFMVDLDSLLFDINALCCS